MERLAVTDQIRQEAALRRYALECAVKEAFEADWTMRAEYDLTTEDIIDGGSDPVDVVCQQLSSIIGECQAEHHKRIATICGSPTEQTTP
jgi:hypothetical protein